MNDNQIREEAIARSASWWECDNLVNHQGQTGLLRLSFPRVFILLRDDSHLTCSFESFMERVDDIQFLDPADREGADTEAILIDAWNFLSLQEEAEDEYMETDYQ